MFHFGVTVVKHASSKRVEEVCCANKPDHLGGGGNVLVHVMVCSCECVLI